MVLTIWGIQSEVFYSQRRTLKATESLGKPKSGLILLVMDKARMYLTNAVPLFQMSWDQFCIRACWGDQQAARCEHIYDVMGCRWNMPSTSGYTADVFETCEGDNAPLVGIYDGSTFSQGQPETPEAHPPAPSSNCQSSSSISHGLYSASTCK